MSHVNESSDPHTTKSILTAALTRHLTSHPVSSVIEKDWSQVPQHVSANFDNVGFDLEADPAKQAANLNELANLLKSRHWDGVTLGWCVRGHVEFTELFEKVVGVVVDVSVKGEEGKDNKTKLMFCEGPGDLARTTLRNFPVEV